jgi:hypothetical protein
MDELQVPAGVPPQEQPDTDGRSRGFRRRTWIPVGALLALLLVGGGTAAAVTLTGQQEAAPAQAAAADPTGSRSAAPTTPPSTSSATEVTPSSDTPAPVPEPVAAPAAPSSSPTTRQAAPAPAEAPQPDAEYQGPGWVTDEHGDRVQLPDYTADGISNWVTLTGKSCTGSPGAWTLSFGLLFADGHRQNFGSIQSPVPSMMNLSISPGYGGRNDFNAANPDFEMCPGL